MESNYMHNLDDTSHYTYMMKNIIHNSSPNMFQVTTLRIKYLDKYLLSTLKQN